MDNEKFYFGEKFKGVYFTAREKECAVLLMKHYTYKKIAGQLGLSPRTIEAYIARMRKKLYCKGKFELIQILQKHLPIPEE